MSTKLPQTWPPPSPFAHLAWPDRHAKRTASLTIPLAHRMCPTRRLADLSDNYSDMFLSLASGPTNMVFSANPSRSAATVCGCGSSRSPCATCDTQHKLPIVRWSNRNPSETLRIAATCFLLTIIHPVSRSIVGVLQHDLPRPLDASAQSKKLTQTSTARSSDNLAEQLCNKRKLCRHHICSHAEVQLPACHGCPRWA